MSHAHNRQVRRLSFQQLENRALMAGDLSAKVVGGDLVISGGVLSNGVQITAGAVPGTVRVEGLPRAGFTTKINHQSAPLTFHVSRNLVIDLGDGDNLVKADGLRLPGSLRINTGSGSDTLKINGSSIGRDVILDTGAGNDRAELTNDVVKGRVEARQRHGDDYFALLGSQVGGVVDIDTSWNADRLELRDSRFSSDLRIHSDAVFAPTRVTLTNVQVKQTLRVQTGNGDDNIRLTDVSAHKLKVLTGAGVDHVMQERVMLV